MSLDKIKNQEGRSVQLPTSTTTFPTAPNYNPPSLGFPLIQQPRAFCHPDLPAQRSRSTRPARRLSFFVEPFLRAPRTRSDLFFAALDCVVDAHTVLQVRIVDSSKLRIEVVGMDAPRLAGDLRLDDPGALCLEADVVTAAAVAGGAAVEESPSAGTSSGSAGADFGAAEPARVGQTLRDESAEREDDDNGSPGDRTRLKVAEVTELEEGEEDWGWVRRCIVRDGRGATYLE
jgi:hypothetical protein